MIPHDKNCRCGYCKAALAIDALSNDDIAELPVWKAWEYAFPHGTVTEVAGAMGLPPMTVESWTMNPEQIAATDPNGRRGLGYEFVSCLLSLSGVFSPGAQFLLRYYSLKLATGETIKGREQMKAVMALADEAKAMEERAREFEQQARAFNQKITAIINNT